jgi:hypothetical protein
MSRRFFAALVLCLQFFGLAVPFYAQERPQSDKESKPAPSIVTTSEDENDGNEPDLPSGVKIDKALYRQLRNEHLGLLRGLPSAKPDSRNQAIYTMMRDENALRARTGEPDGSPNAVWQPIGPAPIPNGQTVGRIDPVSGRVSSIAVHPTNPNIAYVGTAQGGLYRTLDGGATWTPLLDNALSLAIGAVAIAPSDPSVVFVGTGEPAFSLDGFFGVGLYRISNADSQNPVVAGPLNLGTGGTDVFTGRSISEVIVHPTNSNIVFVSTVTGVGGLGGNQPVGAPPLGLYRTSNALAGSPTFEKLTIQGTLNNSRSVIDLAIEPGNPNRLLAAVVGSGGDGGIYLSTNALDAAPTFTRSLQTGDGAEAGRTEFAINKTGSTVTVIAASGTGGGTVYKSTDGGATFPTLIDNNFCTPQCFYDIAVAIDPNDANKVYLGGSPQIPFARALDGTLNFSQSSNGLHVDTHAIAVAPSNTNIIYFGSDGGVWKSIDGGSNWVSQNTSTLSSMQYQSIALHPTDRYFTIGGTQDNGTHFLRPDNSWVRATGGDGGQSVIDQTATDTTNVFGYHTFFNATNSQIGFRRLNPFNGAGQIQAGVNRGCFNGTSNNGIVCSDPVLFYAPLSRGPGNPNTIYMGTNRVYRSANRGDTMEIVSQQFAARVSAIGIAPNNDDIRLAGTTNGLIFLSTTAGAATMTDITGAVPARYVTRFAIDPTNNNIAYVALGGFGLAAGQHVYKTTNLLSGAPTWTVSGVGIPDVPTNALAIDPANTNTIYAGTDIGVFRSVDGGASWQPFSDGLPRVAVFDMAIQNANRFLRIATHGRGIWEISLNVNNVRSRADFDGDGRTDFSVFRAGNWFIQKSGGGQQGAGWGTTGDFITPGDYDGDGKTDIAVYRPTASGSTNFFAILSQTNTFRGAAWGTTGDIPRVGDFDGDGKSDIAVYRPSDNTFYALPTNGGATIIQQLGQAGDVPVVLNYDGDAKTDFAIFRPSTGLWSIRQSSNGAFVNVNFGQNGDILVPADYDNDNKDDIAVFRAGTWFILRTGSGQTTSTVWGLAGDIPAPGDYDGDGADDVAVFRAGNWFALRSTQGYTSAAWGQSGDVPITSGYIP